MTKAIPPWRNFCLYLLVISSQVLHLAAEDAITDQEPFTLGSLSPQPIQDAIREYRQSLQDTISDSLIAAYEDTGINNYIDAATESVEAVANSISESLQGLRSTFINDDAGALSFYKFIDGFIDEMAEDVYEEFEGVCTGSGERRRRARSLAENQLIEDAKDQLPFLRKLSKAMSFSNEDGAAFDFRAASERRKLSTSSYSPTMSPPAKPDEGAITLTLSDGKSSQGYFENRYFKAKSGDYFEFGLGWAVDHGYLLGTDESRTTAGIGANIGIGLGLPNKCDNAKYMSASKVCKPCPRGYSCQASVAIVCPKNRYCNANTSGSGRLVGKQCLPGKCPKKGFYYVSDSGSNDSSDGRYQTICDHFEEQIDNVPCNIGFSSSLTLGVKHYLSDHGRDMNGWGSWDISIELPTKYLLKGITFHIGTPYYYCKVCTCQNNTITLTDVLRTPDDFFGDREAWYLSAVTFDILQFSDLAGLLEGIRFMKKNGGFQSGLKKLLSELSMDSIEDWFDEEITAGIKFSPAFAVGVQGKFTEDGEKWDISDNFKKMPWSSVPSNLDYCPYVSELICDIECPSNSDRRNLRNEQHKQNKAKINHNLQVQQYSTSQVRKTSSSHVNHFDSIIRHLDGTLDSCSKIRSVVADLPGIGDITVPNCFDECFNNEVSKKFVGDLVLARAEDCSEITLAAAPDKITLSIIAYALLKEINSGIANVIDETIGTYADFGVDDAVVTLTITPYPEITLKVSGSPALPEINRATASDVEIFFYNIFESRTLSVTGNLRSFESSSIRLEASLPPTVGEHFSIEGSDGQGASIYFEYKVENLMPEASLTLTQTKTFGISLTMKICVCDCFTAPEFIYLQGDIISKFITDSIAPPAAQIGGILSMLGTWNQAFGLPILHISHVVAGATFALKSGFPAPPSSLILGGQVCLGSTQACTDQQINGKNYLASAAYISLNTAVPQNNFLFAMISSFTIENILNIAAEFEGKLGELVSWLPHSVLDSGIMPPDANAAACASTSDTIAIANREESLNLDCYAYVALSPFSANRIEAIDLDIKRGISFAGKLNLFNVYEIKTKAHIDIFQTTNPSFFLEAQLPLVNLGAFLDIGKKYNSITKSVEGDAYFVIDYKTSVKFLVSISGAISIPALMSYGDVIITVNDDGALLEGQLYLFNGALLQPSVKIRWDWKFSFFHADLGNIIFSPRKLELKSLILAIDTEAGLDLLFEIKITVLSFFDVGAQLRIEERNKGEDLWIQFEAVSKLLLVDCKIVGDAILDLDDITQTEFGEFDVTMMAGAGARGIGETVEASINAVKDFFNGVIEAVDKAIAILGESLHNIIASLGFLADTFSKLEESVEKLFSGNPAGAAIALEERFTSQVDPTKWEDAGNLVLAEIGEVMGAIGDAFSFDGSVITSDEKDIWNCFKLQKKFVILYDCLWFGCTSKSHFSETYADTSCVQNAKDNLEDARSNIIIAGYYGKGIRNTKEGNRAILNDNRDRYPAPKINDLIGTVTYLPNGGGGSEMKTKVTGSIKKLDNSNDGAYSSLDTSFSSVEVTIDLSSNDRRRLQSGSGSISQGLSDSLNAAFQHVEDLIKEKANEDMTGLDFRIKEFGGNTLEPFEIKFATGDKIINIACSGLASASIIKPKIIKSDPDCGSSMFLQSSVAMSFRRKNTDYHVPNTYPCGTVKITREYTSRDKCDRKSMDTQIIFMKSEAPKFTLIPEQNAEKTYSTSVASLSPESQGNNWPIASSGCGHAVEMDSHDVLQEKIGGQCGVWNVKRIWKAKLSFAEIVRTYCADNNLPDPPSTENFQQFHLQDDEPPRIIEHVPTELHIPFFNNYNSTRLNAPLIEDIPTNEQANKWGLAVGDEMLTSQDLSFYTHPTATENEAECRKNGIAHLHREWSAKDKCGNVHTFLQKVIIDHPPESLTSTSPLVGDRFSFSPGVVQSQDVCLPGKIVMLGEKNYAANFNFLTRPDVCSDGQPWDENGCRLETSVNNTKSEILSVKPKFVSFPADVTVNTKDSISSNSNGIPIGTAFCSTPFEIKYVDDEAMLVECGVWEIKRRWTIRPVYDGCVMVSDARLVTERVQVITVKDIYPPEFTSLPEAKVKVPFLSDYGPGNINVSFPMVEDEVYHQTLIQHATLYNTVDKFLFISYNITLSYIDHVDFKKTSADACKSESLADVTRLWTTADSCGNTKSWYQTIHIIESIDYLFGDASGFQMASPSGYINLVNSRVSHIVMSKAEGFSMSNSTIYCSSNCRKTGDISLVLDSCPEKWVNKSYLPDGTVLLMESEKELPKSSKTPKLPESSRPQKIPKSPKHEKICKVFKGGSGEKEVISFSKEAFPVSFNLAKQTIKQISNIVADNPNRLLTGPQTINCTTPDQLTCHHVKMSSLEIIPMKANKDTGNLHLGGLHRVYNFYNVQMASWFYNTVEYKSPPIINVEAEGFVFVTVVDTVNITALPNQKNKVRVARVWDESADFICEPKKTLKKQKSMPLIGNYARMPKSPKSPKSSKLFKADLTYGLRTIATSGLAQDPSTHLLVNLQTLAHINLDEKYHTFTEEDAILCSGLQYQFTPYPYQSSTTKGTYLLPNPISSFELQDHSWEGGQLMTSGTKVKFESVDMKHGLYLPDESSFCGKGPQPLFRNSNDSIAPSTRLPSV